MGNCKDCKSWKSVTSIYGREYHICDAIDGVDEEIMGDYDAIILRSPDDYPAHLMTGPLFGCVQFQLRERNQ